MEEKANTGTARKMARNLIKKSGCKNRPIILNEVIKVIKKEYPLLVESWDLGENVSGVLISEKDIIAIGYNKNNHTHRSRFTVAHEIGHLLLSHTQPERKRNEENQKNLETEAHQFASELLMPLDFLKKDFKKGIIDTEELSKLYWVSKEAMGWRIQDNSVIRHIL